MDNYIKKRVLKEAIHLIKTKDTIRKTAKTFAVSKSTVHMDLKTRLVKIDQIMAKEVEKILKNHDKIKHLRGGKATKEKYKR